jgi:Ca2+-binding RTX toxin-like protein
MIKKNLTALYTVSFLAALAWGCAAPVAPEDESQAGASGSGTDGKAGSGGSSARPDRPVNALPGVDTPIGNPPAGCLKGSPEGVMALTLDAEVPSVLLEATDGKLHANGVACTDASNAELALSSLTAVSVNGDGAEEGAVIIDLKSGDWSPLLDIPESIQIAFASGDNSLVVRGTDEADHFRHAQQGAAVLLDLVGDSRISVVAEGVTQLGLSMNGGDDEVDDFSNILLEAAAELAASQPSPEDGAEPADGEEVEPVTALAIPMIAEGGDGNDWLLGGSADDDFTGGAGDDIFSGMAGDDNVYSAVVDGADIFNGGPGYDYVSYEERTADLTIQVCASDVQIGCVDGECACNASMSGEIDEDDRLVNVEDVTGGLGNDTLRGSEAADVLSGGPGDDSIFGLGGSDLLYGQRGDDFFDGGSDGDYCDNFGQEQVNGCEL